MQMNRRINGFTKASILAMMAYSAISGAAELSCQALERSALELQLMLHGENLSNALSVLESLRKSHADVAISTLEGEVKSSLTVLYSLSPELQKADLPLVKEAIEEAETYVKEHGLKVIKPRDQK